MLSLRKNRRGFGVIEVLVALGILSVLLFGLSDFISKSFRAQKGLQAKDSQREVTGQIRTLLGDRNACTNSFLNGDTNASDGFTVTNLLDAASAVKFSIGSQDASKLLTYTKFKVFNWVPDAGYADQGQMDFIAELSRGTNVVGPETLYPDVIKLKVRRNPAGLLTECFAISVNGEDFWQISPSNQSNIYFNGGRVGIGTNNPLGGLHIMGGIRAEKGAPNSADTSTKGYAFEADGDTGMFAVAGSPTTGSHLSFYMDDQISLKIARQGAPCDASIEGAIRYSFVTKSMEFCNGTNWASFGGSPSNICFVKKSGIACPAGYSETLIYFKFKADPWDPTCHMNPPPLVGDQRCEGPLGGHWRSALYGCCN